MPNPRRAGTNSTRRRADHAGRIHKLWPTAWGPLQRRAAYFAAKNIAG